MFTAPDRRVVPYLTQTCNDLLVSCDSILGRPLPP